MIAVHQKRLRLPDQSFLLRAALSGALSLPLSAPLDGLPHHIHCVDQIMHLKRHGKTHYISQIALSEYIR